jgi:hypothetical protein
MKNPNKMIGLNNQIMKKPYGINDYLIHYNEAPAYIAHYAIQSKETYVKRKVSRSRDDTGTMRDSLITNLHHYFNDTENVAPKNKYANKIKLFLKRKNT